MPAGWTRCAGRSRCWPIAGSSSPGAPERRHPVPEAPPVRSRPLGRSSLEVSALSLGSWRTFERIDRDEGLAVMEAARESGITFLDDARYDDETKTAPIGSGYSEVVFGELFARSGYERAEAIVSNKLWWEF